MNREELVAELLVLRNASEGEFTPEDATKAAELRSAIEAIDSNKLTEVVEEAAADAEGTTETMRAATPSVQIQNKMNNVNNRFSLGKAVKEAAKGQVTGFEAEVIQESMVRAQNNGISTTGSVVFDPAALAEMRAAGDFTVSGPTSDDDASAFVGADVAKGVYTLRPKSVFDKLGVTRLEGLTGNLTLPVGAAAVAANATEVASANQAASDISGATLSPQRIASMLTVSGQLLKQSNENIEAFLMGDLMRAIGQQQDVYFMEQLVEALTLTDGTGVAVGDVIANIEASLDAAGSDRDAAEFLMHPDAFKQFRTGAMVAGVNAITDARNILGYNTVISSLATDTDTDGAGADTALGAVAIAGDFSDFCIGHWGGIDLTVDPYSAAHTNQVRLIVNTHVDAALRQTGNYAGYYNVGA